MHAYIVARTHALLHAVQMIYLPFRRAEACEKGRKLEAQLVDGELKAETILFLRKLQIIHLVSLRGRARLTFKIEKEERGEHDVVVMTTQDGDTEQEKIDQRFKIVQNIDQRFKIVRQMLRRDPSLQEPKRPADTIKTTEIVLAFPQDLHTGQPECGPFFGSMPTANAEGLQRIHDGVVIGEASTRHALRYLPIGEGPSAFAIGMLPSY